MRARVAFAWLALLLLPGCGGEDAPQSEAPADGLLQRIAAPAEGGAVALVRAAAGPVSFAFEPAEVRIQPGTTVRFVLTRSLPESIAFDTAGPDPAARRFLEERGLVRGSLLTRAGQVYDASFRDAPPGRFPFRSVPHASRGMRGVVVVEAPR